LGQGRAADLLQQLQADGAREIIVVARRHHEGVRTADHVVRVVDIERGALVQDGEAVDGDAGPHRRIADRVRVTARVGRSVARQIDDPPRPSEWAVRQFLRREPERVRDRGFADQDAARGLDRSGQGRRRRPIGDLGPVDHRKVLTPPRPLDHGDRDAVRRRAHDRLDHLGVAEGTGDAARLQLELGEVDAA
jgi:hypothetical protein